MDNNPISIPTIGRIVVESYEVEQLADCHLYLLPSNTEEFADKAKEVFGMMMEKMGANQLDYKLELLSENMRLVEINLQRFLVSQRVSGGCAPYRQVH